MKNVDLAAAAREAEVLLAQISESTTIAEKEKAKVAVIVDAVTAKAQVRAPPPRLCTACSLERPAGSGGRRWCGGIAQQQRHQRRAGPAAGAP